MTKEEILALIRKALKEVTPGPFQGTQYWSNADLLVAINAPMWLSYLLTELDAAKQENERLRMALDHVGFYCAGTDFDHVSKWILKNVHGEGESHGTDR